MKNLAIGLFMFFSLFYGGESFSGTPLCKSYLEKVISTVSYEDVEGIFSNAPKGKDEYETTVEYEKRVKNFRDTLPENFLIETGKIYPSELKYDADKQQLAITRHAYESGFFRDYHVVFEGSTYSSVKYSIFNIHVVLSSDRQDVGTYVASNAMGATVVVQKKIWNTKIIFERGRKYNETMYVGQVDKYSNVGNITDVPPKLAKSIKENSKVAFLVVPKDPFYAKGVNHIKPTFNKPNDVRENVSVLVADIQCAFIVGENNQVIAVSAVK